MLDLIFSVQILALTDQRLPSLLHRWLPHELMSSHCLEILVLKFNENDQNKKIKQKTTRASLISAVFKSDNLHLIHKCLKQRWKKISLQPHPPGPRGACERAPREATRELDVAAGCAVQPRKLAQLCQSPAPSRLRSEGPFRNKATDLTRRSGLDLWSAQQPLYWEGKFTSLKGVLKTLSAT